MTMISRCLPRSLQTRLTISSGDLRERAGRVGGQDALGQPARVALLAELEGVEVGDDDLRRAQVAAVLGRDDVELLVVVVRVGRQQHAEPVADGDAGGDDEEGVGEPVVVRVGRLLSTCQAMSMDMTTVLPLPVAILHATRNRSVPASSFLAEVLLDPVLAVLGLLRPPR